MLSAFFSGCKPPRQFAGNETANRSRTEDSADELTCSGERVCHSSPVNARSRMEGTRASSSVAVFACSFFSLSALAFSSSKDNAILRCSARGGTGYFQSPNASEWNCRLSGTCRLAPRAFADCSRSKHMPAISGVNQRWFWLDNRDVPLETKLLIGINYGGNA